jgi:predicted MFS family arabinose efflux permease
MAAIGASAAPAGEENASVALRWYVLLVMMLAYTINIADRYVMSTVLEQIRLDLHLSDSGVAFLTGVSLALFYVSMGIPLSWIADRYNRRNLLAISITLWSVMTTMCGLSRGYIQLLLARMGVGIGEAGGTPSCNSIICDYFPAARRPMALTIFCLGAPIGAWIGADMAGAVAHAYGWRAAFLVLGIPGVLLALLIMATIREPKRGCLDVIKSDDDPTLMETLRFCMSQRSAVHVMMGSGVAALWGWGLMWFIPTFLQRTYQIDVGQAGAIVGPIHLVMGISASLLTAWILGRPSYTDPRKIVYLLGAVTAVATVPGIIAIYTHNLTLATVSLWLFIPGIYFYIGPAFALGQNLAPPKMRAMFSAIALLIANVFNLIVAPQGVGLLSDYFAGPAGPDAASLRSALLILAPTGFWAALHYFLAARTIVADQQRAIGYV